jgi:hypothetical protein
MVKNAQYNIINSSNRPDVVHFETSSNQVKILNEGNAPLGSFTEYYMTGKEVSNVTLANIKYAGTYKVTSMTNPPEAIPSGGILMNVSTIGTLGNPSLVTFELRYPNGNVYFCNSTGASTTTSWSKIGDNAKTATKLSTPRRITLNGAVSGSFTFDGSTDISVNTTIDGTRHRHNISEVNNLSTELGNKIDKKYVIFVGTETQWNGLGSAEQGKYLLKAIVE